MPLSMNSTSGGGNSRFSPEDSRREYEMNKKELRKLIDAKQEYMERTGPTVNEDRMIYWQRRCLLQESIAEYKMQHDSSSKPTGSRRGDRDVESAGWGSSWGGFDVEVSVETAGEPSNKSTAPTWGERSRAAMDTWDVGNNTRDGDFDKHGKDQNPFWNPPGWLDSVSVQLDQSTPSPKRKASKNKQAVADDPWDMFNVGSTHTNTTDNNDQNWGANQNWSVNDDSSQKKSSRKQRSKRHTNSNDFGQPAVGSSSTSRNSSTVLQNRTRKVNPAASEDETLNNVRKIGMEILGDIQRVKQDLQTVEDRVWSLNELLKFGVGIASQTDES